MTHRTGGIKGHQPMVSTASRRSSMTLFAKVDCLDCHRIRLILAEKGVACEILYPDPERIREDLLDLNPYGTVPTFIDRDLILYDTRIILEYLDERFPHPPLMPVDPASRGRFRLAMMRMERDWYPIAAALMERPDSTTRAALVQRLRNSLEETQRLFAQPPYFLGQEFSLVDITMAPLLWRLPQWGIAWTPAMDLLHDYAERVFARPAFDHALAPADAGRHAGLF